MIRSCKYCLSFEYRCDDCNGTDMIIRPITEYLPPTSEWRSETITICLNRECRGYGRFYQAVRIDTAFVCDACKRAGRDVDSKELSDALSAE